MSAVRLPAAPQQTSLLLTQHRYFSTPQDEQTPPQPEPQDKQVNPEDVIREVFEDSADEWNAKIMAYKEPIILDCYASWCQPCKKLTPVLEEMITAHGGKLHLVKMNIEKCPGIASQLNVKSIPALFLIFHGKVMDTMVGADMEKVKKFMEGALVMWAAQYSPKVIMALLDKVKEYIEAKQYENAFLVLRDSWDFENWREYFGAQLSIGLAYVALQQNQDPAEARAYLARFDGGQTLDKYWGDLMRKTMQQIQELETKKPETDSDLAPLEQAVAADPSNIDAKLKLAHKYIEKEKHVEGAEQLIEIIKLDKAKAKDEQVVKPLTEAFKIVGFSHPVMKKGRNVLMNALQ